MSKPNLILIHSFPTNSILLKGLIQYLDDYFKVYFIDLPGFITKVPPLEKITVDGYSNYVEEKIKELDLDKYYLGGISFGFLIINHAKIDRRCKGIFAIEPFTGIKSLRTTSLWRFEYGLLLDIIYHLNLARKIWNSKIFRYLYPKYFFVGHSKVVTDIILNEIDGKTFLDTARLLLKNNENCHFHNLPYALIVNKDDVRVKYVYLSKLFRDNIKRLLIVDTTIEHYPKRSLLKSYFTTKFPQDEVKEVIEFFDRETTTEPNRASMVSELYMPSS
jgi:pimeloyl-ACP methyl ester carboxylesterase